MESKPVIKGLNSLIRRKRKEPQSGSVTRLVTAGNAANADKRWPEAEAAYADALALDPALVAIWIQYGHALKEQGKFVDAEDAYRRAIALDPDDPDGWLQLGHVLKLQGAIPDAINAYRCAYLRAPEQPIAEEITVLGGSLPSEGDGERLDPALETDEEPESPADADLLAEINAAADVRGNVQGAPFRSLAAFRRGTRLSAKILLLFDHEFYRLSRGARGSRGGEGVATTRGDAVLDFALSGVGALLPIREGYEIDVPFYRQTYFGTLPAGDEAVYRNWLNGGVDRHCWPNRTLYVRNLLGEAADDASALDLDLFAAFTNVDRSTTPWTAIFDDFINRGAADPHFPLAVTPSNSSLLVLIADRLAMRGHEDQALLVYERVIEAQPDLEPALYHYGDVLLRRSCLLEAARVFGKLVATRVPSIWAFINLAVCQEGLGDPLAALQTLHRAIQAFPGDQGLRQRFNEAAGRHLTHSWTIAAAEGRVGRLRAGQDRLVTAHDAVSELVLQKESVAPRFVRAVALVGNTFLAQCRFYRIDQKLEQLRLAGFEVELFDYEKDLDRFEADIYRFQAVIFFRVPAFHAVMQAIQNARALGIATFYDIDDPIFDASLYPPPIENYENQIGEDEYNGLALGVPLFHKALALCDHGITSTPSLARCMARVPAPDGRARSVFLHRNALGSAHLRVAAGTKRGIPGEKVVIFYGSGTRAHKSDFVTLVEPALVEIAKRHKNRVSIVLAGYIAPSAQLDSIRDNIVIIDPTWDVERYWTTLSIADINIAVLKPDPLTDTKSEIKWLEAAMLGIPSIVSNTDTYRELLTAEHDAVMCDTVKDWTSALDRLIRDPELRERIGRNAYQKAMRDYAPENMAENLTRMIRSVTPTEPSRKPLVLLVNVYYPPQAIGGATRVLHDNILECRELHGDAFDFAVFTTIEGGISPYALSSYAQDGIMVTGVTTPDRPDIDHVTVDEQMGRVFGAYLDEMQPALIHFHCIQRLTVSVIQAVRDRDIPYLITAHDGWWISDMQFLLNDETGTIDLYDYRNPVKQLAGFGVESFERMMQLKPALYGAEKVLPVSRAFAQIYADCGVPNVAAVPNGVSNLEPMPRVASTDGRVRMGFVGGLSKHKGFDLVRHALKNGKFDRLQLVLIDHSLSPGTVRRAMWGATEVIVQAKTPQKAITSLYAALDVVLAPSLWPESYGLVTREALVCGCWVVASDRGAIGEDIQHGGNGFRVDVSDSSELAAVFRMMNGDPGRFTVPPPVQPAVRRSSDQAADLVAIYRTILDGPAPPAASTSRSLPVNGHRLAQVAKHL